LSKVQPVLPTIKQEEAAAAPSRVGLAERVLPAKNKVMRTAMGLEGNLPKLARGEPII